MLADGRDARADAAQRLALALDAAAGRQDDDCDDGEQPQEQGGFRFNTGRQPTAAQLTAHVAAGGLSGAPAGGPEADEDSEAEEARIEALLDGVLDAEIDDFDEAVSSHKRNRRQAKCTASAKRRGPDNFATVRKRRGAYRDLRGAYSGSADDERTHHFHY